MKDTQRKIFLVKLVIVISLLAAILLSIVSCEDMGFPSSTPSTSDTDSSQSSNTNGGTVVSYKDAAILAVYQHLLAQAGSPEAKIYLADFYTVCENWDAVSEYFKDGSGTWHVLVDMSGAEEWEYHAYWQQASWFVFRDGRVIPSNLFQSNALRIEADLQDLSPDLETIE
jgi:hypothetical protein